MTIVYCIDSLIPSGGMQRVLTVKANYLAEAAGYTIHIVTRTEGPSHFTLSPSVHVHAITDNYKTELILLLYAVRPDVTVSLYGEESRFLHKLRDGSKKVLEFHFTRNHLVHLVRGLPNVRLRRLRVQYARFLQYMDERYARHYHRLVLLTEADRLLWGCPRNAVVIPNPLSFTSTASADPGAKRILSTGRLIATKGFDLLIDAFREIAHQYPDWRLSILGEGQDKQYLLDRISRYGLGSQIEICPPTSDIAAELLQSSIYAVASRYEGFGLVITEAMECGIPCVSFDCECGPGEIIMHNRDGLLVEPLNTKKFAEALQQLISSPALRIRMGQKARIAAQRFAVPVIMSQWEALFHSITRYPLPSHVR